MFKKLMYRHVVVATIMAMVMSVMAPFAGVASAEADPDIYYEDGDNTLCISDTHQVLIDGDVTSFFYRTETDAYDEADETFAHGYGYGYTSGGGLEYGYGYGYGYGFFCNNANDLPDSRYGFFFGSGGDYLDEFVVPVDGTGEATLPMALVLNAGSSLAGVAIYLPEGLVINGPDGWDGVITVEGDDGTPASGFDMSEGVTISVNTGLDVSVALSDPVIIQIPVSGFGDFDHELVRYAIGDTVEDIGVCGADYTGSDDDTDDLVDYTLYDLGEDETCYNYYDGNVYVATTHFTDFAAGDEDTTGGGGGGGGFKKVTKKATAKVSDFSDLGNLKTTDWEYPVVVQMIQLGLFKGSLNAQGQIVFNMYGNMNRAEAAVLIARYLGYNDKTVIGSAPFNDVPASIWYASSVAYLKSKGVVNGKSSTVYAPGDQVSRTEFFKMMVEAYMSLHPEVKAEWDGLMASGDQPFTDVTTAHWSHKYMRLAAAKSLLSGYTENGKKMMKPDKSIFRIEGGAMISKILAVK